MYEQQAACIAEGDEVIDNLQRELKHERAHSAELLDRVTYLQDQADGYESTIGNLQGSLRLKSQQLEDIKNNSQVTDHEIVLARHRATGVSTIPSTVPGCGITPLCTVMPYCPFVRTHLSVFGFR